MLVAGRNRVEADLDREFAAVLAPRVELAAVGHVAHARVGEEAAHQRGVVRPRSLRHQHVDRLPEQLRAGVAEQHLHLAVHELHQAGRIHHGEAIRRRLHRLTKACLAFLQGIALRGDVTYHGEYAGDTTPVCTPRVIGRQPAARFARHGEKRLVEQGFAGGEHPAHRMFDAVRGFGHQFAHASADMLAAVGTGGGRKRTIDAQIAQVTIKHGDPDRHDLAQLFKQRRVIQRLGDTHRMAHGIPSSFGSVSFQYWPRIEMLKGMLQRGSLRQRQEGAGKTAPASRAGCRLRR